MDVRDDTAACTQSKEESERYQDTKERGLGGGGRGRERETSDGGLDEGVELLVTTDGELQVTRCDALHLEVL